MSAPYTISKVLDVPGIRHGFFGREGGRSQGDLAGNNMSITQGDNPDLVVSNRSSAANAMGGYDIKDLVVFRQTHSTTVVTLTERPDRTVAIEADAMVTNRPDLLLGILTADCAPVLLADPEAGSGRDVPCRAGRSRSCLSGQLHDDRPARPVKEASSDRYHEQ